MGFLFGHVILEFECSTVIPFSLVYYIDTLGRKSDLETFGIACKHSDLKKR
jgi:hypothetical protein